MADGNGWRKTAVDYLTEHDFAYYNPYEGVNSSHGKVEPNEILHKDIHFLDMSSIVLVNLDLPETIPSKGAPFFTIGEMFLAHRDRKPIIAYTNCFKGRPGYEAIVTKTLPNLEECLEYISSVY